MKLITPIKYCLFVLLFSNILLAQEYIFFGDSPDNTFYDPSWGFVNVPSYLELKGTSNNKFPVDANIKFSGNNSLMLHWNSQVGGDWGIATSNYWFPYDVNKVDSIVFMIYSEQSFPKLYFPVMFIEDIYNNRTAKKIISNYISDLQPNAWTRYSIPLDIFKGSPSVDYTQIKTIFWGQNIADATEHKVWIDDVKMIAAYPTDTIPPSTPSNVSILGYEKHIEIFWTPNTESDVIDYKIYRKVGSDFQLLTKAPMTDNFYLDFFDSNNVTYSYKVSAIDFSGNESGLSNEVSSSTHQMTDEEFLTMVQRSTFRYFWDYAHPISGLARERLGQDPIAIGGSGFGVMSIIVAVERGFVTRSEAANRILKILNFLYTKAETFHGAFPHWLNGETGKVIPFSQYDNGGDLVETAYLIQGLLTARQYFSGSNTLETQIRDLITNIWNRVEWAWYRKDTTSNFLYWHWSPTFDWQMNMPIQGYNETMIAYLLAIASPTFNIPAKLYKDGWASSSSYVNGGWFYGYKLWVGWNFGGPLFFAHYSFLGFDPRNKKDNYANYFLNNRNHTLINRAYCIDNPKNFIGYNENTWGLTASDDPWGYLAHEPDFGNNRDNGTISPTAAISSIPYTPKESIEALKNFYRNYGSKLYGFYGFKDAFNPTQNWFANSYLAIDQGPIIVMIENYRSGLLWNNFMANPEIPPMLNAIGFVPDSTTDVKDKIQAVSDFKLIGNYPNPFNPGTTISFAIPYNTVVNLSIYNTLGEKVTELYNGEMSAGENKIVWDGLNNENKSVSSGIYIYRISTPEKYLSGKMILQK